MGRCLRMAVPRDTVLRRDSDPRIGDVELMIHLRDGDASALEALVGRYWEPLVRYAARLLNSVDGAEDTVQDAFLTVWQERKNWKPVGTPQAYFYRIVRNRALQELRASELHTRKSPELARRRPSVPTPLDVTEGEELDQALQRALASLPERRREAFVLTRYHRLSLAEVAETMGVSTQTVSNHVSMAVAELRKALQPFLP
jgi:RNA polymerase sigma-70 factor, ECF subfamily